MLPFGWSRDHQRGSERVRFGWYRATCSCSWRGAKERHGPARRHLLALDHALHINDVARQLRTAQTVQP